MIINALTVTPLITRCDTCMRSSSLFPGCLCGLSTRRSNQHAIRRSTSSCRANAQFAVLIRRPPFCLVPTHSWSCFYSHASTQSSQVTDRMLVACRQANRRLAHHDLECLYSTNKLTCSQFEHAAAVTLFKDADPVQFGNFSASVYSMFQVCTGDGWSTDIVRPLFRYESVQRCACSLYCLTALLLSPPAKVQHDAFVAIFD